MERTVMEPCRIYWGSHGCTLERGHEGGHFCCCNCMITRDRRAVLILWLVVLGLILTAFAADGLLKDEVCVSGQIADQYSTTTYPTVCQ